MIGHAVRRLEWMDVMIVVKATLARFSLVEGDPPAFGTFSGKVETSETGYQAHNPRNSISSSLFPSDMACLSLSLVVSYSSTKGACVNFHGAVML